LLASVKPWFKSTEGKSRFVVLLDFLSPRTISFFFANERKTTQNINSSSAPSFHRFVIYKRTQYTHLQNGPFDAIRFSWQANYRKQGFLQTVRVFDLRVMELRVELRLSFFLFYAVRSLLLWARLRGKIDDGILLSMFVYSHSPLLS
jgi:hypothetical protein